jgi:hypothetical protein
MLPRRYNSILRRHRVIGWTMLFLFAAGQLLGVAGFRGSNAACKRRTSATPITASEDDVQISDSPADARLACCCSKLEQSARTCCCSQRAVERPAAQSCCGNRPLANKQQQPAKPPTKSRELSFALCLCGHAPTDNAVVAAAWLPKLLIDRVGLSRLEPESWLQFTAASLSSNAAYEPASPPPRLAMTIS